MRIDNNKDRTSTANFNFAATVLVVVALLTSSQVCAQQSTAGKKSNAACIALFNPAYKAGDFKALSLLFNNPPESSVCSEATIEKVRIASTQKVIAIARERLQKSDTDGAMKMVTGRDIATFRLSSTWRLNELRGDIAAVFDNWSEASSQYETAYELSLGSNTTGMNPQPPADIATQERLFLLANEAMQLAGEFGTAISRSGVSTGTFGTRGVKTKNVPLPVEFDFASDKLTDKSLLQVPTIVSFLQKQGYRNLDLVGHTDWVGKDASNQVLSVNRAKSLARAIQRANKKSGGEDIKIKAVGLGETCPRVVSDRARFTDEQLAALYRRVEMRWPRPSGTRLKECDASGKRE